MKGFDDYVVLWKKQVKAGEEMLKAAKALEEKSAIVRNYQKPELQAIFSLLLIVSVLIAILAGITAGVLITRAITTPDRQLVSASQTVAEGDLTRDVEVKTGDEVATEMTSKIIEEISTTIKENASAVQEVSASTEEQTASMEEMASSAQAIRF